jgi:RNA polymerase sigma factor (sigma-70 family)
MDLCDLVSEIWLKTRHIADVPLLAWKAHKLGIDFYRQAKRRQEVKLPELELPATESLELLAQDIRDIVESTDLTTREREVIYLTYYEGLSSRQAAIRLNCSYVTICSLLKSGLRKLQERVGLKP